MWEYHGEFVDKDQSQVLYDSLKKLVKKEQSEMKMYGKTVKEPRFKQFFSRDGHSYKYSGMDNESAGWPEEIETLAKMAKEKIGCAQDFDSALVNYYPDGNYYLNAHNDKDAMEGYIASFSFGSPRTFRIRNMQGREIVKDYELENGSLLVMNPGMQKDYVHEVPKRLKVLGGRINVTLRQQQHITKKRKIS